jgi:hypothetical protein
MTSLRNTITAALLVAVGAVDAQAGTISLQAVSGSLQAFQTPTTGGINKNDVIPGLWGYLNGNLVLNGAAGADYLVEFTLVGSESGWTNRLKETQGGTTITEFSDNSTVGDTISYLHTATGVNDFLKFQFATIAGSAQPILVNGLDPDGMGNAFIKNGLATDPRTFFVSFCIDPSKTGLQQQGLLCNDNDPPHSGFNPTTGNIAWIALDDSGAGPNDDHDDWVGYVRVTAVPDGGATVGLLTAALLGLGALRRRFSA